MNTMWATVILFNLLALSVQSQPTIVNRDISTTLYDNLKFFAQYAGAGYCDNNEDSAVDTVISCIDDVCPDVTAAGAYNIVEFIGASTDQEGFVAIDPKNSLIVVSFRGSDSIENFIYDILFTDTDCEFGDGCKAECGFYASWLDVKEIVLSAVATAVASFPDYQLVTTGHSLGGAVAVIAGAYLRDNGHDSVDIYTYGCPRVFNDVGADYVTAQGKGGNHRVTHLDDLVPRLPPIIFGYRHISPEYWLSDGTDLTNEYAISEIKICTGIANTSCNAGEFLFSILAHWHYFEALSACWDLGLKRQKEGLLNGNWDEITVVMGRGSANVSATTNALQKTWLAQLDMQFVEALGTVA